MLVVLVKYSPCITITLHPYGYCVTVEEVTEESIKTLQEVSTKIEVGQTYKDEYFSFNIKDS